ncbi:hypothetical protein [Actinomadura oligospora]|uniref:hypothetical protein n=1 Tax=Actinomadura oligospora TaxID=111804 RepID=UPI00047CB4CF|nr:hypothetical protein [Actinomadura oligospora]
MTTESSEPFTTLTWDYDTISLGGETAVVVPLHEFRVLRALADAASPEALEQAEGAAFSAELKEWREAGCPGALSHEEFMALTLESPQQPPTTNARDDGNAEQTGSS